MEGGPWHGATALVGCLGNLRMRLSVVRSA